MNRNIPQQEPSRPNRNPQTKILHSHTRTFMLRRKIQMYNTLHQVLVAISTSTTDEQTQHKSNFAITKNKSINLWSSVLGSSVQMLIHRMKQDLPSHIQTNQFKFLQPRDVPWQTTFKQHSDSHDNGACSQSPVVFEKLRADCT